MNKGDRVYTLDGRAAEYVADVDGTHAVRPFYDTDDGEVAGDIEFYHRVYAKAPTAIYDADIARARETLTDLESKTNEARRQLREAERDLSGLKKKLQQNEALRNIDACLDGSFNWVAIRQYGIPKVMLTEDAVKGQEAGWRSWTKLMTLFGDTKGNLQWRINHYNDGSGGSFDVWPCLTEQEARDKVTALYNEEVDKWRKNPSDGYQAESWTSDAPGWLPVAQDVLAAVNAKKAAAKAKAIADMEAKLAEARNA